MSTSRHMYCTPAHSTRSSPRMSSSIRASTLRTVDFLVAFRAATVETNLRLHVCALTHFNFTSKEAVSVQIFPTRWIHPPTANRTHASLIFTYHFPCGAYPQQSFHWIAGSALTTCSEPAEILKNILIGAHIHGHHGREQIWTLRTPILDSRAGGPGKHCAMASKTYAMGSCWHFVTYRPVRDSTIVQYVGLYLQTLQVS